jgi:PAS domain S-box-containing protein
MSSGTEDVEFGAEGILGDALGRLVVERSHDLITLAALDGTVLYASPSWSRLGWEPRQLAGVPLLELIHPEDAGRATAAWERAALGEDVDAVALRVRRPSGAYLWVEVNGSGVRGEDGELRFMLGTARDVDEREELRSRLRDLDAVYRFADAVAGASVLDDVLDAALDALLAATGARRASVLLADEDGVFRFRAWRGLSDAYRAFAEGHSPWAPDEPNPQPVLVEDVADAGLEPQLERVVREEGIAALAFVPLLRGGRLLGKFMLYHDEPHAWSDREVLLSRTIANHLASVTERTQAQDALRVSREQLSSILRTVEEGISATSREGRFLFANDAAARVAGLASAEELLALSLEERYGRYEVTDPEGRPVGQEALPSARAAAGEESSAVVRIRTRDGAVDRWLAMRATPVRGADGEVELVVNVTRDITEETQARRALEASQARLALLLEASEKLSQTLDYDELLRRVPALVVPRIADGCHVYVAREDGRQLARVAHAHVDPEVSAVVESVDPVYDVDEHRGIPVVEAFRSGEPVHQPTVEGPLERFQRASEKGTFPIVTRSVIAVPLETAGRRLGVLTVVSREPGRHGQEDLELISELARRVSFALDAVVLHQRAQDSLAQLRAVLAQLPLGVAIADPEGRLAIRNEEMERIWGTPLPVGMDVRSTPADSSDWPLSRALDEGEVVVGERHELEREDGTRTLEISSTPVRDENGEVVSAVAVVSDVTRRWRSEEQLRFLAQASELLVTSLDWQTTLTAIAELAVPSLAGYLVIDLLDEEDELECVVATHADPKRADLVREMRDRYPPTVPTHPVQVALRTGEAHLLADLQAEVDAMAHDRRHAKAIREIANTSGIVAPLAARGRTLGVISLGTVGGQPRFDESDVQWAMELARRISLALDNARLFGEAQERAHAAEALEYVDDGVFLVDEAGIVRLWNPTAAISLRRPPSAAVGRPIAELITDWQTLESRIPVASEPQPGTSRAQALPVEVQGEERWLAISAVRFPGGTVYAFRDVTDERAVEQMKSDFVSTVSHELRTPLAAIYGAAMTLRRRDVAVDEPQQERLLDVISNEAERLARIVNDILWASRLESGKMSIAIERCDAAAIAAEVADAVRARLPESVELAVDVPAALPPTAADPDKLRQILTNLLDNAVKYSPDGGRVELEVARSGGRVRFRVADHGLGIPPAEQDRIFEKFFRLDPNLTRGVGGTGLGLYISRELVLRMNGRIWVVSDGRSGSSFFVELPIA